jgi:hypothetical protein
LTAALRIRSRASPITAASAAMSGASDAATLAVNVPTSVD